MLRCAQPSYGVRTGPNYGHDEIREAGTVKKNGPLRMTIILKNLQTINAGGGKESDSTERLN